MAKEIVVKINDLVENILSYTEDGCQCPYEVEHLNFLISAKYYHSECSIRVSLIDTLGDEDDESALFNVRVCLIGRWPNLKAGDLRFDTIDWGFLKKYSLEERKEVCKMLEELFLS